MPKFPVKTRLPLGILFCAITLAMSVAVAFLGFRGLSVDREAAVRLAEIQSRNLAQAVDQNLSRLLQRANDALATIASELEGNLAQGRLDLARMRYLVASQERLLPEALAVRITDREGRVIVGQPENPALPSLAARPYFHQLRDGSATGTWVSRPMPGTFANKWMIVSARRYNLPGGRFGGVVVAPIFLERFREAILGFDPGPHGFLELRDDQGAFMARSPALPQDRARPVGSLQISDRLRALLDARTQRATYFILTKPEQSGRTISFRRLERAPIIVLAALSEKDYLDLWRRGRVRTLTWVGAFLAGLWLLAAILLRSWKTREQGQAEQRLLQAQLAQAQKMDSLGSLAGGVAHDMNNVLGAILALASTQKAVLPKGTPAYRAFDTIAQAAARGSKVLKGLLNFARKRPAEVREVDLNALLREQVQLLERTTLAKFTFKLDLDPGLRHVRGDAGALSHAILNLCVNAVDAMAEHGLLTLRTRGVDGGQVEVQVEDTGAGMSQEVLAQAMDPFFTTKPVGEGTGLGLSMVYSTVQAHLGRMEIRSEPGRGTCVTLRFPGFAGGPDPALAPPSAHPAQGLETLDVLLVDDDDLIQISVQGLLETLGHRVTSALSGEEALRQVAAGSHPDLVILDMNMPGIGGKGTLPRLRALRPDLPILLATGRADQAALDLAASTPWVTLVAKPFDLEELKGSLARIFAAPVD